VVAVGDTELGPRKFVHAESAGGTASSVARSTVFAEVLKAGPVARTELAARLDLSQSTITKSVNPLLKSGYLVEVGTASSGGRPRQILQVVPEKRSAIGVVMGPRAITGVVTDLTATVRSRHRIGMTPGYAFDEGVEAVASLVAELAAEQPELHSRLLGVGVGLGGHVDTVRTRRVYSGLLGWHGVDLAGVLSERLGLPVVVNNDVNALAVAEHWFGYGRDATSFAVVTVGVGIGCGLVLNGSLYSGASGAAAELGHIPVVPDGPECECGRRGCLEAVIGDVGVLADVQRRGGRACDDIDEARAAARAGDPAAAAAFASMGGTLGRALATLCNLLNLETIVLTGEGAVGYDLFGPSCEREMHRHGFSTVVEDCALVLHLADHNLWARGAACLAISESVRTSLR
jgi:predicted NBD/HSP70 family sugar kinase